MNRSGWIRLLWLLPAAIALAHCGGWAPVRCRVNDHCPTDLKCDTRQGLCVKDGFYIEGEAPSWTLDGGTDGGAP
jgi:hypothetical protein